MRSSINLILKDRGMRYIMFLSCGIFLIQLLGVFFVYIKLPPLIPLFNSLSWGRDRLTGKAFVFIVPFLLFAICGINLFFSGLYYKQQALLSRMLAFNFLLACILSFIALVQIFLLVF